jgi:competence protein ComEA
VVCALSRAERQEAAVPQSPPQEGGIEQEFWENQANISGRPRRRAERRSDPSATTMPPRPAFVVGEHDGPLARIAERLREWRGDARFGVVVLVLVAVVAGVVWYRIGVGGGGDAASAARSPATHSAARATPTATTGATTGTASGSRAAAAASKIVVHVAGAVAHAGVVELAANARVIDAIEAVGGAQADGDLDRLNLAAKLADGERVYVAKVGQADPGVVADGSGGAGGAAGSPGAKVNLNTATQAQLESLPGIGPTYAQAIIAARQARGGFKSVNELRNVRGIGDKRFSELEPLVTV